MDVNAEFQHTAAMLDSPILYPSPYVVMGLHGYTKHYYAGAERICAKIGEGFGAHFSESRPDLQETAFFYHPDLCGSRAQSQTRLSYAEMKQSVRSKHLASERADEVRIGISHITTTSVQHLQYLPFGERYIDQHPFGYQERFTFTGNAPRKGKRIPLNEIKYNEQRDEETGFGYFGARYMDHELMTMWLSVDPMADKYPSISPYAYCAWNPVKLVDPEGKEAIENDDIVLKGTNNSSVTVKTDLVDITVNADHDFGGNYTLHGEEVVSAALDLAGIVDPSGVCDGANAALQAKNGEWGGAALSVAGLIPYVGDLAKIGKVGKDVKIIKNAINGLEKNPSKGLSNPFKGKTFEEIDGMF